MAIFGGIKSYVRYAKLLGSVATGAFVFIFTFMLCFALLSLCAKLYTMRVKKLENPAEAEDKNP